MELEPEMKRGNAHLAEPAEAVEHLVAVLAPVMTT